MIARTDAISSSRGHLLCDGRHRGLAVRVDDSRCGYPAVEHPSRQSQPLGVPAHDDDFDGAAGCQQRRPQPGMLTAPCPQGALRLLFRLDEHERRPLGVERQPEPVDEVPRAGSGRPPAPTVILMFEGRPEDPTTTPYGHSPRRFRSAWSSRRACRVEFVQVGRIADDPLDPFPTQTRRAGADQQHQRDRQLRDDQRVAPRELTGLAALRRSRL